MRVFALGTTLKEVSLMKDRHDSEEMPGQQKDVNDTRKNKNEGYVFIGTSNELQEMSKRAKLVYDGDIHVNAIEFCKVESQQECLASCNRFCVFGIVKII